LSLEISHYAVRYLFKLRKYLNITWDITCSDGKYRTAHAMFESKLLTHYITTLSIAYLDGGCRGVCGDYAMLYRKTYSFANTFIDKNCHKCYENKLKPDLKKLSEVNRMYLFSYSVQTIVENMMSTINITDNTLGGEIQLYRKPDLDLLKKFSDAQQLKNDHSNRSTFCQHLRDTVMTLTATMASRKNAYMYRNPEFLICDHDPHWLDNKYQLDFGFVLDPKLKDSKHVELTTVCSSATYMKLLMQNDGYDGFHDDYEQLHIRTPSPPREDGKKPLHPYYMVGERVKRWLARLTYRAIRLLDEIPDPGLRTSLKHMKVTVNPDDPEIITLDKIDTVFLMLGNQQESLSTPVRKMYNKTIRKECRPFLGLWNILINCLSYYPGLRKLEQPVDALINLLGCNGIPGNPILHNPSQYVDGDDVGGEPNMNTFKRFMTYPDGKFDPQNQNKRSAIIPNHELQVSWKKKSLRYEYRIDPPKYN